MAADAPVVLIVEDEAPIAQAISWLIEDLGYTPLTAGNGEQGLALAELQPPDLIITDFMMPRMSGGTMIAGLRARLATMPPIILLTAAGPPVLAQVSVDAVLAKPFAIDELERLVRRLLHHEAR